MGDFDPNVGSRAGRPLKGARSPISIIPHSASAQTNSTSTVYEMLGANLQYSPSYTGRMLVIFAGSMDNSLNPGTSACKLKYGIGIPPAALAAETGTTIAGTLQAISTASPFQVFPLTVIGQLSNLSRNTVYWFDLAFASITAAGATDIFNPKFTLIEL